MSIALLILMFCSYSHGQADTSINNSTWKPCPWLSYIPVKDSVDKQRSIDSIAILMVGRWELIEIASGWGHYYKPIKKTELILTQNGEGTVYENSDLVSKIKLNLKDRKSSILFDYDEEGQSTFKLGHSVKSHKKYGTLQVCEEKLFLGSGMADGIRYAFRRIL